MKQRLARDSNRISLLNARRDTHEWTGFTPWLLRRRSRLAAVIFAWLLVWGAYGSAETAAFDLVGPQLEVRVQREGQTLPISEVPSLQAGDRLWVHPALPDNPSLAMPLKLGNTDKCKPPISRTKATIVQYVFLWSTRTNPQCQCQYQPVSLL